MVSFPEFKKIELRAAKILKAEEVPEKDRLYKLTIDLGKEQRTIVAGLREFYSSEQLEGKTIIVVANLDPATIAGIKSEAMLLAIKNVEGKYSLLTTDGEVEPGTPAE